VIVQSAVCSHRFLAHTRRLGVGAVRAAGRMVRRCRLLHVDQRALDFELVVNDRAEKQRPVVVLLLEDCEARIYRFSARALPQRRETRPRACAAPRAAARWRRSRRGTHEGCGRPQPPSAAPSSPSCPSACASCDPVAGSRQIRRKQARASVRTARSAASAGSGASGGPCSSPWISASSSALSDM